jgi:hypothetical protein
MVQGLWVGAAMLVGGLAGLRRGWRRQTADAAGCAAALVLACWQHGSVLPYVHMICAGPATRQVALVYLFAVLYGLLHVLASLYVPSSQRPEARRWIAGLIGAGQAGVLAVLTISLLPQV